MNFALVFKIRISFTILFLPPYIVFGLFLFKGLPLCTGQAAKSGPLRTVNASSRVIARGLEQLCGPLSTIPQFVLDVRHGIIIQAVPYSGERMRVDVELVEYKVVFLVFCIGER